MLKSTDNSFWASIGDIRNIYPKEYVSKRRMTEMKKIMTTLNHNLLIAKLGPYGFDTKALYYIKRYLDNRKQRVYVHRNFSSW